MFLLCCEIWQRSVIPPSPAPGCSDGLGPIVAGCPASFRNGTFPGLLLSRRHGWGIPTQNRRARFRTVVALILGGREYLFEGVVEGQIIDHETGHEGFGYDPLFRPDGYDRTFAQMTTEEKNAVSHRARAVRKLATFLHEYVRE